MYGQVSSAAWTPDKVPFSIPVEWGLVVLDVPDFSVQRVWVRLLMSITMAFAHNHTQTLCMPT